MAEVLLLHHAQGLTPGVVAFGEQLRMAGHTVHTPDMYDGRTFDDLESGMAYAREVGFGTIAERGAAAAGELPPELVYVGISLGVMPGQQLAQTRPGAVGAVFIGSAIPAEEFGGPWPESVPLQVHGKDADPIFAGEGDLEAARELVSSVARGELFLYPGEQHLFVDSSLPDYDEEAARLVLERVITFLSSLG